VYVHETLGMGVSELLGMDGTETLGMHALVTQEVFVLEPEPVLHLGLRQLENRAVSLKSHWDPFYVCLGLGSS